MQPLARMLMLTTAMLALSACQSFPLTSWMFKRGEPRAAQMVPDSGSASLAEGRAALQAGRIAAAIGPLRVALLDQATRAPASNALGVAYAQLGREDIAEQFFKSAIAADPSDERFVANLLRLQHAVLARKARSDAARLAAEQGTTGAAPAGFVAGNPTAPLEPVRQAGNIERRSRGEVFLVTATATTAPTATVGYLARKTDDKAPAGTSTAPAAQPSAAPAAVQTRMIDNPLAARTANPALPVERP